MPGTLRDDGERGVGRHRVRGARDTTWSRVRRDRDRPGAQRGGTRSAPWSPRFEQPIRTSRSWSWSTTARPTGPPTWPREPGRACSGLPFNLGIGGAVQTGYQYALENGFDIAIQVDGDGQHDPSEIARLLEPILDGRADMVVGTRFAEGGGYRGTRMRRVGIHHLRRGRLADGARSGSPTRPRASARSTARRIRLFAADYPHDYPEVEATVVLARHGLTHGRGAGADAGPRDGQLLDHRPPLGLLHDQGPARPLHRAVSPLPDAYGGAMTPVPSLDCRRDRRADPAARHLRADPEPPAPGALCAALAADGPRHLRARDLAEPARPACRPGRHRLSAVGAFRPRRVLHLLVLLHYSTVISKLSEQNTILAQRLAMLENRLREGEPGPRLTGGGTSAVPTIPKCRRTA